MRCLAPGILGNKESTRTVKTISVLGSTGSIGRSTLDVVRQSKDRFKVELLMFGKNSQLALAQALEFKPRYLVTYSSDAAESIARDLPEGIELVTGENELIQMIPSLASECIVAGVVGVAGLKYVVAALSAGKRIALANKESLVAAGQFVDQILKDGEGEIFPVDSEHSALYQALSKVRSSEVESLVLTASGGPFFGREISSFPSITPDEAIKHPKWNMGAKISIDSATMFNKGLELIEAYWLFGVPEKQIEVSVHRQSIIHSMVRLSDGTLMAQMSNPDMCAPIALALTYPGERVAGVVKPLDLNMMNLTFEELDPIKFPAVKMARYALSNPRILPLVYNLANELAVSRFRSGELKFTEISTFVDFCMELYNPRVVNTIEDVYDLISEVQSEEDQLFKLFAEKIWV